MEVVPIKVDEAGTAMISLNDTSMGEAPTPDSESIIGRLFLQEFTLSFNTLQLSFVEARYPLIHYSLRPPPLTVIDSRSLTSHPLHSTLHFPRRLPYLIHLSSLPTRHSVLSRKLDHPPLTASPHYYH